MFYGLKESKAEGRETSYAMIQRDPATLSVCDGSGDGVKWKLEKCLGGHINRSWRVVGFEERLQKLSERCMGLGAWEVG